MFDISGSSIRLSLFAGGLLFFLFLEVVAPYRPSSVSKLKRWTINLSLTLINSILIYLVFLTAVIFAASHGQTYKSGILNMVQAPIWLKTLVTLVFLDFVLYVWHLLNHKISLLWRFHRVHHSDLNMDVSTATRFHLGEHVIFAVIKISVIFFLGASPAGILVFESTIVLCAQFHHSSLKVPKWFETFFWIFFVPPSMHRIHHSVIIKQRDTNYGTIFSLWDRFLGTLLTRIDQPLVRIGMGAYPNPNKLNLNQLLAMPFTRPVK